MKKLSGFVFLLIVFFLLQGAGIAHEIHRAVIKGNLSEVKCLLQKDPQALNLKTEKGLSALHLASELGYPDIVKLLVEKGAYVNVRDVYSMSPLHWASLFGHTEVIEYLLANKADIQSLDKCGRTPLHFAAGGSELKAVRLLVESGAPINVKDLYGDTSLVYAAESGSTEVFDYLSSFYSQRDWKTKNGNQFLFNAVQLNNIEMADHLIRKGVDVNAKDAMNSTPVIVASSLGHYEMVKLLIDRGARLCEKDREGSTALHWASSGGYEKIADLLISRGADVNAEDSEGFTPLHAAALYDRRHTMKLLAAHGAAIDAKDNYGITPLKMIQKEILDSKDNMEILSRMATADLLLMLGAGKEYSPEEYPESYLKKTKSLIATYPAAINSPDEIGLPPVLTAAMCFGHDRSFMEWLLSKRADLYFLLPGRHNTPLHVAATFDNDDVAEALIGAGIETNSRDIAGETPLCTAVRCNSYRTAKVLLSHGADIEAESYKTKGSMTPLHIAMCSRENSELVELLLDKGSNLNARTRHDRTPLQLIITHPQAPEVNTWDDIDYFKLLVKRGADVKAVDSDGNTLLHHAARHSSFRVARFLLSRELDCMARNNAGETPLHMTGKTVGYDNKENIKNSLKIAELLISKGADVNARDNSGWTPLHIAVKGIEAVSRNIVIFHGLIINQIPKEYYEGYASSSEIVEFLVNNGADVNARENNGKTPLRIARKFQINKMGYFEILDFKRKYMNKSDICLMLIKHGAKE